MEIVIQPIGLDLQSEKINEEKILQVAKDLAKVIGSDIKIKINRLKYLPHSLNLFNKQRIQCVSDRLLDWLLKEYNPDKNTKILAICDFDAYVNGLNFVFGQAHIEGKVLAIFLPRLKQEFYGQKKNDHLFYQRIIKEAIHEIGHAFGLRHCENRKCVMYFSKSLCDTDTKNNFFCNNCQDYFTSDYKVKKSQFYR